MLTEYHDSMLICHLRSRLASLSTCKIVASASIPSRQSQQIDCLLSKFHICKFNYCTFQALTCKNSENIAAIPQCSWSQCQGQSWFQGFLNFQMLSQSLPFPRLWVYLLVYPFLFVGGGALLLLTAWLPFIGPQERQSSKLPKKKHATGHKIRNIEIIWWLGTLKFFLQGANISMYYKQRRTPNQQRFSPRQSSNFLKQKVKFRFLTLPSRLRAF